MEPNQPNNNMLSYSKSSSSSSSMQNNSKNSERRSSKKSILRKEGSQSKNKDKHATFVEPLNQVEFYIPDMYNQNKNHRISLNTVSEEPEQNSRSSSDQITQNNLSSIRVSINSDKRISFTDNDNINISDFNDNNYNNNNNNVDQLNNSINNNIESSIIFKNQHSKKPTTRKTLDSEYVLNDFFQTNDINNFHPIQNVQNEESKNNNNIITNTQSKVVKIRLSSSGRNSFPNENSISNLSQSNPTINISNNSNSSTNEKIEEQTKINTELNKNLFNKNNPNNLNYYNDLNNNPSLFPPKNNINIINTNANSNINPNFNDNTHYKNNTKFDSQINEVNTNNDIINNNIINDNNISKKSRKPNFRKRITIGIIKEEEDIVYNDNNNNINDNNDINNINNYSNNNTTNFNGNKDNLNINNINNLNNKNINTDMDNMTNIQIQNNDISNTFQNKSKKIPKMNKKRITMGINSFNDNNIFNEGIFEDNKNQQEISLKNSNDNNINNYNTISNNNQVNNNIQLNKNYTQIILDEPEYVEPKIVAENKNLNYTNYEKYLKYNDNSYPLSEKKININAQHNIIVQNNNKSISQTVKKNPLNDSLLNKLEIYNNIRRNKLDLDSSPLVELIHDKSKNNVNNDINYDNKKYQLVLNNDEDIEKEIDNQFNFIKQNLEEKEKDWKEKIIRNAERHQAYESEINQNDNEIKNIERRTNEVKNQINDLINNRNKYDKLSEKAQIINNILIDKGINIKDIELVTYKEVNCLLFTIMIKNILVYKFLISDNIRHERNISGELVVTFLGVIYTEMFTNYFSEETIINKDKNKTLLFQKYFEDTIKKIFPNQYEEITMHDLSYRYYLSTQISLCFIHIMKMINHISIIDDEISVDTQDLKKYIVKFKHITIYGAKLNFEYILNIENPFTNNYLNSVEVEKYEYILDDFDEYRKGKINVIWKYFNPKDIQINHTYFYNMNSMLYYIDKIDVLKTEINDEYIFNVMQGNIPPNEDNNDDLNDNFDSMELLKQLGIIYGKNFISQLIKESENTNVNINDINIDGEIENNKENDDEEIILDLPPSNNEEENDNENNNDYKELNDAISRNS